MSWMERTYHQSLSITRRKYAVETVTVYHGTSEDNANAIINGQSWLPGNGGWFSPDRARAQAYGPAIISVDVPRHAVPRRQPEFYLPAKTRLLRTGPFRREASHREGSFVALYPRTDDALQMVVPGGIPQEDLHLTLASFEHAPIGGQNADALVRALNELADSFTVIVAQVMGHATFNPGGPITPDEGGPYGRDEPCTVYIVTDSEQLSDLRDEVLEAARTQLNLPPQHTPWVPHVTAAVHMDARLLSFTGQVLFDRMGLTWQGRTQYFPLLGSTISPYSD